MLRDNTLLDTDGRRSEISLWRFMIDQRFQKLGYGRRALELVLAHARSRPGITSIQTSYVVGPHGPRDFYLASGFRHTDQVKPNGEVCLTFDFV
ncbi:GNAT family N-acetyltransferase [Methylibium sp. T29-B]|uniref:GNAT family N-acetyltransferase n=1 Tax=Methylibium sp. T29-B TaxID=1437443 RepID=UPI0038F78B3C